MKKILLIKSLEDYFDLDYIGGFEQANSLSVAITRTFLPKWGESPLKTLLISRFHHLPSLRLAFEYTFQQRSDILESLALTVVYGDIDHKHDERGMVDLILINDVVKEYFYSIGYLKVDCKGTDEIETFVKRLAKDVPLAEDYFKVIEIDNEEGLEWYRYHSNPYHNPNKVWSISVDYGGTMLRGEIINYDKSSVTVMMTNPAVDLRIRDGRSHIIWGNEGKKIAHQLLIDLFHAYQNINENIDVIREKYKVLSVEYANYDRRIDEADDFEEREALEFEKRNFFKQSFREIIGFSIENMENYFITNKFIE